MSMQFIPPDVNIDFVGKRYFFVALSTLINLAAIVLLVFVGLNYGVDFVGGSIVQVRFANATDGSSIRKSLQTLDLGEVTVQDFGNSGHEYLIRFERANKIANISLALKSTLGKTYGDQNVEVERVESVGAKVG